MTVYVEATQSRGLVVKGEIKKYGGIVKIEESDLCIRYIVNENREYIWSKDMHRIINIQTD